MKNLREGQTWDNPGSHLGRNCGVQYFEFYVSRTFSYLVCFSFWALVEYGAKRL